MSTTPLFIESSSTMEIVASVWFTAKTDGLAFIFKSSCAIKKLSLTSKDGKFPFGFEKIKSNIPLLNAPNDPSKLKAAAKKLFGERLLNYGEVTGVPASKIRESFDGELLDFGGIVLEVLWTPGHSSHSQSFWEPDSKTVFVGDAVGHTMGDGGPGVPVSPPPHNPLRAVQSIDKIIGLGPETLCIAHNGPHNDAVTHLKRIKERSIHWGELAVRGAKEEMSLEGFSSFVLEEDEKLSHHIKDLPSPMTELGANLLGFWLYGKWKLDQG